MPQIRYNKTLLSWPKEYQGIQLSIVQEPDEDPIDLTDQAPFLADRFWGDKYFGENGEENKPVDFAEITYPDEIRVYYNGKRVSLMRAHQAIESGLNHVLRIALDRVDQNTEASHSQA